MIIFEKTPKTPLIQYNNNILTIHGISTPENSQEFYRNFNQFIDADLINEKNITVDFFLEYFNTSSSVEVMNWIKKFAKIASEAELKIIWRYFDGDEEMLESGQLYEELANISFEFIEMKDE